MFIDYIILGVVSLVAAFWAYYRLPGEDDGDSDGGQLVPENPPDPVRPDAPLTPTPDSEQDDEGPSGDGTGEAPPIRPSTPSEAEPVASSWCAASQSASSLIVFPGSSSLER